MRLRKRVGDELKREANPEFVAAGSGAGEHPIVESTTAAEATAIPVEGEAGAQEGINLTDRSFWRGGRRFADAKRPDRPIERVVERQAFTRDFRENPAEIRALLDNRREIDFARERRINGDGADVRVGREPTE